MTAGRAGVHLERQPAGRPDVLPAGERAVDRGAGLRQPPGAAGRVAGHVQLSTYGSYLQAPQAVYP